MRVRLIIGFILFSYLGNAQTRNLDSFIIAAQQNSPLIKGYQNQILQNQLDSLILRASLRTQVNLISNDLYAPVIKGWGYDEAITNRAQVSGLVQATRNFVPFGNRSAQFRAIGLQSRALTDTILLTIRDLKRTIVDQYITVYADQLTANYSEQLYNLLKKEEEALRRLAQTSVIKQTEFLAFDITLQQQEITLLQAKIQYTTDYLTLNYISGIGDTTLYTIAEPHLTDSLPVDPYNSIFYQRFVTDSLRISNERQILSYSYKPVIGAYTDAGYNSSLQVTPYKNFGFSVGVNLKVPIYDGHQRKFKTQRLDIDERTRAMNRDYFIKQYTLQTRQLSWQLHSTDQVFEKIKKQVEYTQTLIQAYAKLLQTSDIKVTDFVLAITNYLNAQNTYRQNMVSRLRILNQLNYYNR